MINLKTFPFCNCNSWLWHAFYFLSLTLRAIPVGIAYAVWLGIGITLITIIGWIVFDHRLDMPAILGITPINHWGCYTESLFKVGV